MSKSRNKRRQQPAWGNSYKPAACAGPTVINATLNSMTNQFDIFDLDDTPSNARADFGVSPHTGQNTTAWATDAPMGWGTASAGPNFDNDLEGWVRSSEHTTSRYSSREPTTFRLNTEIPDEAYFAEVVDYASYKDKQIVPEAHEILQPLEAEDERPSYRRRRGQIPHIPVNRVRGPYESTEQYLYTHFELMRQDCLMPLQKAVRSYRAAISEESNNTESAEPAPPFPGFRLYEYVHLNAIVFGARQVLYRISFRLPNTVRVSWRQSKRLIEGSLVLLSKDNFETDLKIATVVQRGEEPMLGSNRFEYLLDIYLERDNDDMPLGFGDPLLNERDSYVMLEATEGYFEAYRHVLSVLKDVDKEELPFDSYLVDVSKEVQVPFYASRKRFYDIDTAQKGARVRAKKPVDIMGTWPDHQTCMDKTQMDALRTILSNNVAIVQGPPGTGKTFVGTYAMKVLLNNFGQELGPIVCICQTNHALDQFLEHILNFDDRILRIGGRSKSELLKDHLIYEVRKSHGSARGIGRLYRKRDDIGKNIRNMIVEMYENPCVTLDYIAKIKGLRPRQIESLKRMGDREEKRKESNVPSALDDDSDEEWEISSEPQPKASAASKKKQQPGPKNTSWGGGNPNIKPTETEKAFNPVEVWLRDAIEYMSDSGTRYTFDDALKDDLLEQKGLIFEEEMDETELIDEEELQEITMNFKDDQQDLRGNKSPYINIGASYRKQSADEPPQLQTFYNSVVEGRGASPQGRKVVNYSKSDPAPAFDAKNFNFFDDNFDESLLDTQHHVLERWMKDDDVTLWPLPVRLKAHKKWVQQRNEEFNRGLQSLMRQYEDISRQIRKLSVANDAQICREHRIVGMTSTASAKYHDLLEAMRPKVLVVEEAAEMLEAHIVSALTSSLQHVILIGDHQQLRPSTAVHDLSEHHYMGVSLFERLVNNDVPYTRLSHQRRMLPDIRTLIDPIYNNPPLRDHPDVFRYPPVKGMEQPVYFLSHNEAECHMADTASKSNEHEAQMAAKLTTYLLLQGYSPDDITIITMYAGQRSTIKKFLREERRPSLDTSLVKVSSVDGYQGEENKIIILSLVRSNTSGAIGFLKVANRVCVSLSRAKHGMYILGNAHLLCEKSDLWNEIVANLENRSTERIGTKLTLKCHKHNVLTKVQWPADFSTVEEGGCTRPCGSLLNCGHQSVANIRVGEPYQGAGMSVQNVVVTVVDNV
ncbi:NFX1-type zinc finger-containing protein 1 [Apophysomyces sp. BC1034]|nr:NFX1-type zinc finger-containing protein 1 [Apophysomyces sp. BC1015]KAG0176092.1 NFX1-type zinc finger-containing protein 1 [Apophysomyces sp. BC1021]KAG0186430.1 NFX1-type zinc finger-containing protein 1 [Apophysomyces sp. BC1034]